MKTQKTLADLRRSAGFAVAIDAAFRLNISRMYLLQCEEGRTTLSADLAEKMATLYVKPKITIRKAWVAGRRAHLESELRKLNR